MNWWDSLKLEQILLRELSYFHVDDFTKIVEPKIQQDLSTYGSDRWQAMKPFASRPEMVRPIQVLPFLLVPLVMLARGTVFEGQVLTWPLLAAYAALATFL